MDAAAGVHLATRHACAMESPKAPNANIVYDMFSTAGLRHAAAAARFRPVERRMILAPLPLNPQKTA